MQSMICLNSIYTQLFWGWSVRSGLSLPHQTQRRRGAGQAREAKPCTGLAGLQAQGVDGAAGWQPGTPGCLNLGPLTHQLCPSPSKGLGAQPDPGNLDVSEPLALQGAGRHGPVQPRAQGGRCSLPLTSTGPTSSSSSSH